MMHGQKNIKLTKGVVFNTIIKNYKVSVFNPMR